jgi:hypothetical protein
MKLSPLMFSALLGATMLNAPALADETGSTPHRCFSTTDFENWKAPDARTIYIRVGVSRYYRLDLSAPCQALLYPNTHLVTKWRGSNQVCAGIDWDLSVADSTGGGFRQACIVKTQTPMTPAEVAAIPRKFKP